MKPEKPTAVRRLSAPATRRARAAESFKTAADCIGPVEPGMSLFAVTRGQFSMLDAVLHVITELGPSRVSLWTWSIAQYEIACFADFMRDGRITAGTLVIDGSFRRPAWRQGREDDGRELIRRWREAFGPGSVRYVLNHAKLATVEGGGRKMLLRGSMNLNFNPRFEQLDVTEGGPDFDLVRQIEAEIPSLDDDAAEGAVQRATRVGDAFDTETLDMFAGLKRWTK